MSRDPHLITEMRTKEDGHSIDQQQPAGIWCAVTYRQSLKQSHATRAKHTRPAALPCALHKAKRVLTSAI